MCGRFERSSAIEKIGSEFNVRPLKINIKPSYNIAPSQNVLIISFDKVKQLSEAKWGFIPSWAKDPSIGNQMINARAETISSRPAFRSAFKKKRCLIIADGFYEWKKLDKGKVPYYIHLKSGRPFGFGGIFNNWTSDKGDSINTCAIITTNANELIEILHDRMPVIIPNYRMDEWLDTGKTGEKVTLSMLAPYPSDKMEMYEISRKVNSPAYNSPDVIEPVMKDD